MWSVRIAIYFASRYLMREIFVISYQVCQSGCMQIDANGSVRVGYK